jgi:UDP-N-acetylglucosamine diphosphorylase/glucosamine-1-phosphate N-acetyltransferase
VYSLLMTDIRIVIMAGGMGKRMNSSLPKVLCLLHNKPMLAHVLETAQNLNPSKVYVVVGNAMDVIMTTLEKYISLDNVKFVYQPFALGTGNAVLCARPHLIQFPESKTIVLSGDVPLLSLEILNNFQRSVQDVGVLTSFVEKPFGYGRIVTNTKNEFERIVEEKDCDAEQKRIQNVNSGIYMFKTKYLTKHLPSLTNHNAQREYYLTDVLDIIRTKEYVKVDTYQIPYDRNYEVQGVNTSEQLNELEAFTQK